MRGEREKENRTREMVHNYVKSHPGASLPDMMRILQIPEGTLRYHLDYLVRKEKIDTTLRGSRRCYFPSELSGSGSFPGVDPSTLSRDQIRIIEVIKRNPGISRSGITDMTNIGGKELSRNLRKLRGSGIIWKIQNGGEPGYEYITDEGLKKEMLKLLIMKLLDGDIDEDTFIFLKEQIVRESNDL